jgi:hypothetical protein
LTPINTIKQVRKIDGKSVISDEKCNILAYLPQPLLKEFLQVTLQEHQK